jgi:hypothetical protein
VTTLPLIAAKLAAALRNMPCTCRPKGMWPAFANATKVSQCARCAALEQYDAYTSIVAIPGAPQGTTRHE